MKNRKIYKEDFPPDMMGFTGVINGLLFSIVCWVFVAWLGWHVWTWWVR